MLPSMASLHVYNASMERVRIIETTLFFSRVMGMNGGQDSEGRAKREFGNTRVTLSRDERCFISSRLQ